MTEGTTAAESDPQVSFKVKTSADGNHNITMAETATVLDLKNKLSGTDFEDIPVERQRLIYSGRVMKNEEPLSTYKIKSGNTIHMVKSAQSNAAQNPANSAASPAAAVPTNMASGTANNPLAGLTGARYAGHMGLPGAEMFGADGGMGAPPTEDQMATLLEDPNTQAMITEAMNNPAMVDMMIQANPMLRDNPQAREMLRSPEFRRMMLDPAALRQAAQLRRMMGGGGAGAFPAPGVTDTTPGGTPGTATTQNQTPYNPFGAMGTGTGINAFGQLFPTGPAPTGTATPPPPSAGSTSPPPPSTGTANNANAANPFASLFGGGGPGAAGGPGAPGAGGFQIPGMPPLTPELMQQAMEAARSGGFGNMFGGGGFGQGAASPAPADTRPPEERYAEQLRQLNDMGFFDFNRNVEALRRSGGSVQGAIEQLLSG
ncbi:deubiquitination-protection protein dph1 [Phlyctema vagabunda]|uniref:Deubiquitination-protection protein dph1 n=1 Tax=Phlyctema vagabunda TaxID=108571 RepID=A0ABR4PJG6_9HELO